MSEDTLHVMAFVKGSRALAKCGAIIPTSQAVAREGSCPTCQIRSAWPDRERQRQFDQGS